MKKMSDARKIAVKTLLKIEKDKAYSNITLSSVFREYDLKNEDKAFISALVYGVLDRKITLDYVLSSFMKTPLRKTAPYTLNVLRTALYQIMFMDKIPESAAVNEAVKLIKNSREGRNSGFVNAVLRAVLRADNLLPEGNSAKDISVKYSCPLWIVESLINDYGIEDTVSYLEESLKAPPFTIRVNTQKTSSQELINELLKDNISSKKVSGFDALILSKGTDIIGNNAFEKGLFYAQDLASQTAIKNFSLEKGNRVLDMCAAPGGKSFSMALSMENEGEIISCDLYEHRVKLIKDTSARLGLDIIKPIILDATVFNEELGKFDCVLCDVPCSGLGVLRRKPDIKYKEAENFDELEQIQYKILSNAVNYLKDGGKILYSTCTLRKAENEKVVNRFLKEYNGFVKLKEQTLMPQINRTDGFYFALLKKH